jgi:hypothetical protein
VRKQVFMSGPLVAYLMKCTNVCAGGAISFDDVTRAPSGDQSLHEIKFDGFRVFGGAEIGLGMAAGALAAGAAPGYEYGTLTKQETLGNPGFFYAAVLISGRAKARMTSFWTTDPRGGCECVALSPAIGAHR